jgi:hypothetical protein
MPGGAPYTPGSADSQRITITFSAAPANGSSIIIPDGSVTRTFLFTYSGSPGVGVIPLVAGGGTATQTAVAAQAALDAQLTSWDVTTNGGTALILVSRIPARAAVITGTQATGAQVNVSASTTGLVPAAFGKMRGWLSTP